jgi:hypothetical protein
MKGRVGVRGDRAKNATRAGMTLVALSWACLAACGTFGNANEQGAGQPKGSAGATSGGAGDGAGGDDASAGDDSGGGGDPGGAGGGNAGAGGGSAGSGGSAGGGTCGLDGATGACVNATDCAVTKDAQSAAEATCAKQALGSAANTKSCMMTQLGITDACAQCWGDVAACGAQHCFNECVTDSASQACRDCTAQNCVPAFTACAGI